MPSTRLLPVELEERIGHGGEVPVLLVADPVVPGVLTHARRAVTVRMEATAPARFGVDAEELRGLEGGDLEESGTGAVEHDREQPAHFVLDGEQLPDSGVESTTSRDRCTAGRAIRSNSLCPVEAKSATPWVPGSESGRSSSR
jgi:hypothetical protein